MSVSLTPLEKKAYEIIRKSGKNGILQSELWRRLGVDSREGSRIALRLVKKGLIEREPVIHNGKRTYRLMLKEEKGLEVDIDSVINIPCFICPDHLRCGEGSYLNPVTCPKLTRWILNEAKKSLV